MKTFRLAINNGCYRCSTRYPNQLNSSVDRENVVAYPVTTNRPLIHVGQQWRLLWRLLQRLRMNSERSLFSWLKDTVDFCMHGTDKLKTHHCACASIQFMHP